MKVLLLGSGGFIGSSLKKKIAAESGNAVIAYQRTPGKNPGGEEHIEYIIDEFRNFKNHTALFESADTVIHTISSLLPVSDSMCDEMTNVVTPTLRLLDHFKNTDKHFIFISSGGSVYDLNSSVKLTEDMPLKAYNFYGLSKITLENILLFYKERYGTNITILRPSNVFGYRNNNIGLNGIISTLISNCVSKTPTTIWGSGNAVRDYIHIDDFAEAVYKIALKKLTGVYNISSDNAKSVNEIIAIINKFAPDKCIINHRENLYHLPEHIVLDNSKIKGDLPLGGQPVFEQKIKELVAEYYAVCNKNPGI